MYNCKINGWTGNQSNFIMWQTEKLGSSNVNDTIKRVTENQFSNEICILWINSDVETRKVQKSYLLYSYPFMSPWFLRIGGEGVGNGLGGVCIVWPMELISRWFCAVRVTKSPLSLSGGVKEPGMRGWPALSAKVMN